MHMNSISYNYKGDGKVSYGAPPRHVEEVGKVYSEQVFVKNVEADKGENLGISPLQGKTTFIDPLLLLAAFVPVCRIEQKPGMFIVTATRGFHSGFNRPLNIAEAVNYAGVGRMHGGCPRRRRTHMRRRHVRRLRRTQDT